MSRIKQVELVTKAISKHGKLKAENKKKKKMLKKICPHHKYNRHGKVKPTIFPDGDGACICTMCGATFPAKFFSNNEIKEIVGEMKSVNEQAKYLSVAVGAGQNTVDYHTDLAVKLGTFAKSYKKLRGVASKKDTIKKKKNKRSQGSAQYGSWGSRN